MFLAIRRRLPALEIEVRSLRAAGVRTMREADVDHAVRSMMIAVRRCTPAHDIVRRYLVQVVFKQRLP